MKVSKAISNSFLIFKKIFFAIVITLGIIVLWIMIVAIVSNNLIFDINAAVIGSIGFISSIFTIVNYIFPKVTKSIKVTVIILTILFSVLFVSWNYYETVKKRSLIENIIEDINKNKPDATSAIDEGSNLKDKIVKSNYGRTTIIIEKNTSNVFIMDSLHNIYITNTDYGLITNLESKQISSLPEGNLGTRYYVIINEYNTKYEIKENIYIKIRNTITKAIKLFRRLFKPEKDKSISNGKMQNFFSGMIELFRGNQIEKYLSENIPSDTSDNYVDIELPALRDSSYSDPEEQSPITYHDSISNKKEAIRRTLPENSKSKSELNAIDKGKTEDINTSIKNGSNNSSFESANSIQNTKNGKHETQTEDISNNKSNTKIDGNSPKTVTKPEISNDVANKEEGVDVVDTLKRKNQIDGNEKKVNLNKEEIRNFLFQITNRNSYPIKFIGTKIKNIQFEFIDDNNCNTTLISRSANIRYICNVSADKTSINVDILDNINNNLTIERFKLTQVNKMFFITLPDKKYAKYELRLVD